MPINGNNNQQNVEAKNREKPKSQSGFALLTVLLVVALVSMVSSQLLYDQQVHIQRSTYMIHQAHSMSVAYGFEGWVKKGLMADLENNKTDNLNEQWAQPLAPIPFAQGTVSGRLLDLQARFNVNNVLEKDAKIRAFWKKMLERYLAIRLPTENFAGFGDVLQDWVDADDDIQDSGAESQSYLLNDPAYRAANTPMVMPSELQKLQGMQKMSARNLATIESDLTALPDITAINVNTADSTILMSLADWLTEDIVKQWIEHRKTEPAEDVHTFLAFLVESTGFGLAEIETDIPSQVLDVKSSYFLLQAEVDYGDVEQVVSSIFNRKSEKEVILVQRWLSVGS
ncbi:type II secretion system minor pseudopilin GspK [Thiomicrorhabdus hydrogeniphila]